MADNLATADNVVIYVMLYPTSFIDQSATSVVSEMFVGYTVQLTYPSRAVWSIPYSGKLWRALNLANQSSECIGEFLIWQLRALPHRAIVCEIILAGFKFGSCLQNRQFAKLKTLPKFPAIRYNAFVQNL